MVSREHVAKNEIYVFAHGRSGGSALLYWIAANHRKRITPSSRYGLDKYFLQVREKRVTKYGLYDLDDYQKKALEMPHMIRPDQKQIVYIIRSPHNFFASQIKGLENSINEGIEVCMKEWRRKEDRSIRGYKQLCREYLGESKILPDGTFGIIFDRWFQDADYRKEIAGKLHLKSTRKMLQYVPRHGLGSSFDRLSYRGKAQQMKVTERWKELVDNPVFLELFQDEELVLLSEKIFGKLPFDLK